MSSPRSNRLEPYHRGLAASVCRSQFGTFGTALWLVCVAMRSLQRVSGASSRNKRVSIALERSPQVRVEALLPGDP
jgi:hypothetical protein